MAEAVEPVAASPVSLLVAQVPVVALVVALEEQVAEELAVQRQLPQQRPVSVPA